MLQSFFKSVPVKFFPVKNNNKPNRYISIFKMSGSKSYQIKK